MDALENGAIAPFSDRHMKCTAGCSGGPACATPPATSSTGGLIRTWGVSLLAVAAIAASLLIVRRAERPAQALVPAGETLPAEQSLDAIREAGL